MYTQQFGNILTRGTLHVAPDSPAVADFLSYAYEKHRRATEQQRPHSLQ